LDSSRTLWLRPRVADVVAGAEVEAGSGIAAGAAEGVAWTKKRQFQVKAREFVEAWTEMANEFQ